MLRSQLDIATAYYFQAKFVTLVMLREYVDGREALNKSINEVNVEQMLDND